MNEMLRRRAMMDNQSSTPAGVVFYDRLVGDGVAYIDTGVLYNPTDIVEATFANSGSSSWRSAFGCASAWGKLTEVGWGNSDNYNANGLIAGTSGNSPASIPDSTPFKGQHKHHLVLNLKEKTGKFDGGEIASLTSGTGEHPSNVVWGIFGHKTYNGRAITKMTFLGFLVKSQEGEIKADYVPCTYLGEAGMWDMVSNTFFGNANTSGSFTVAND